jgi:hypothetical protein
VVWRPDGSQERGEVTIWCSNDYLGTERLRITPTPRHNEAHVSSLVEALVDVWKALGLPLHNGAARYQFRPAVILHGGPRLFRCFTDLG